MLLCQVTSLSGEIQRERQLKEAAHIENDRLRNALQEARSKLQQAADAAIAMGSSTTNVSTTSASAVRDVSTQTDLGVDTSPLSHERVTGCSSRDTGGTADVGFAQQAEVAGQRSGETKADSAVGVELDVPVNIQLESDRPDTNQESTDPLSLSELDADSATETANDELSVDDWGGVSISSLRFYPSPVTKRDGGRPNVEPELAMKHTENPGRAGETEDAASSAGPQHRSDGAATGELEPELDEQRQHGDAEKCAEKCAPNSLQATTKPNKVVGGWLPVNLPLRRLARLAEPDSPLTIACCEVGMDVYVLADSGMDENNGLRLTVR